MTKQNNYNREEMITILKKNLKLLYINQHKYDSNDLMQLKSKLEFELDVGISNFPSDVIDNYFIYEGCLFYLISSLLRNGAYLSIQVKSLIILFDNIVPTLFERDNLNYEHINIEFFEDTNEELLFDISYGSSYVATNVEYDLVAENLIDFMLDNIK